jgi:DNA-binding response OmpR family regulator
MSKILLVEDEKVLRDAFMILLDSQDKYDVDVATNGKEALEHCKKCEYDLILLDLMMPILDGVGFLEKAKLAAKAPGTRVVVMSNLSSGEGLVKALQLGAHRQAVKSDLAPQDVVKIVEEELALAGAPQTPKR